MWGVSISFKKSILGFGFSFLRRLLFPWCTPKNLSLSQLSEEMSSATWFLTIQKVAAYFLQCLGPHSLMETIEGTISPQPSWLHIVSIWVHFIQLSFPLGLLHLFWTLSNVLIFLTSFLCVLAPWVVSAHLTALKPMGAYDFQIFFSQLCLHSWSLQS